MQKIAFSLPYVMYYSSALELEQMLVLILNHIWSTVD